MGSLSSSERIHVYDTLSKCIIITYSVCRISETLLWKRQGITELLINILQSITVLECTWLEVYMLISYIITNTCTYIRHDIYLGFLSWTTYLTLVVFFFLRASGGAEWKLFSQPGGVLKQTVKWGGQTKFSEFSC